MRSKVIFTVLLTVFTLFTAFSQKIIVKSGNFDFLKGQTKINVVFNYDNLNLLKENINELQYTMERTKDLNSKSKGSGDIWKQKWNSSKELLWNPMFIEQINQYSTPKELSFQENTTKTKYTLVVEVVWIHPGLDSGRKKQPAQVTTDFKFVETANKKNVLLNIICEDSPGNKWENGFENETRIAEGFAQTGKEVGKFLVKKIK